MFLKRLLVLLRFRREESAAVAAPEVEFYPAFAFRSAELLVAGGVAGEVRMAGAVSCEVRPIGVVEGAVYCAGAASADLVVAGCVDGEVLP